MALPETIRVKLSTEDAGTIALTPVVVQELAVRELVGHMLAVAGKDAQRVCELLQRGTLVVGGSRFRWTGWDAALDDVRALLATFPDPDPTRAFAPDRATQALLRGPRGVIAIPRAAGERTGIFQRRSFWSALLEIATPGLRYAGYSYRERADRYVADLAAADLVRLREAADLLRYSTLRDQVRAAQVLSVEVLVER